MPLTKAQQQFAEDDRQVVSARATAGSGKSTSAMDHVRYSYPRLQQATGKPPRIALATFSRGAAFNAQTRFQKKYPDLADNVTIGTLHRLVLNHEGTQGRPIFLDDHDRESMILLAMEQTGWNSCKIRKACKAIDWASSIPDCPEDPKERRLFETYAALVEQSGCMDISLLLRNYFLALQAGQTTCLAFEHIVIDEVQDLDPAQLAIMQHHAQAGIRVTVIGDPDQTIFDFRNAVGWRAFRIRQADGQPASAHFLSENFRCARQIVAAAQRLIEHNRHRIAQPVIARSELEGSCTIFRYATADAENTVLADQVGSLCSSGQTIGVLCYTNAKISEVTSALDLAHIPYSLNPPREDPFDGPVGTPLRHLAMAITEPDPLKTQMRLGLALRALNMLATPIDSVVLDGNRNIVAIRTKKSPLSEAKVEALESLPADWVHWQMLLAENQTERVIRALAGFMRDRIASTRRKWLQILVDRLCQQEGPLRSRFRQIRNRPRPAAQVQVLTIHGSKGLEFDHVFVADCSGRTPHQRNRRSPIPVEEIEQARRLLFVALTRARISVALSWSEEKGRSPLLDELEVDEVRETQEEEETLEADFF